MSRVDVALAELCRRSFSRFAREFWPVVEPQTPLVSAWYVDALCAHLQATFEGRLPRLVVSIPPGHAKSLLAGVLWPAWCWTRNPGWRLLSASYAFELAARDSQRCRGLVQSEVYERLFGLRLREDSQQRHAFELEAGGGRRAVSVGGSTTGWRCEALLVDDALNALDAYSEAARKEAVRWFNESASTRLNSPSGPRVVIGQRLHQDDLTGHLLAQGDWAELRLPTEYEAASPCTTPLGWKDPRTTEGELLCPERLPPEAVGRLKRELGSYAWAAQHQQRPAPLGGGMLKREWFKRSDKPPALEGVVVAADLAFKSGGDENVFVAVGRRGAEAHVLELVHSNRWEFPEVVEQLKAFALRWNPSGVFVEEAANGAAAVATLRGSVPGLVAVPPRGSKEARVASWSPLAEAGQVWLPEGAPWAEHLLAQLEAFPNGAHDDCVDALGLALSRIRHAVGAVVMPAVGGRREHTEGAETLPRRGRRWRPRGVFM